jgi:hypothetical protein
LIRQLVVTFLLLPAPASGVEPKAVAKAPATAAVGTVVRVDTTGQTSDLGPLVRVWSPPDGWQAHYTEKGDLIGFEVLKPGTYLFVSVASGTAADGSRAYVATFVQTQVTGGAAPTPTPIPTPPVPPAPPLPTPTPVGPTPVPTPTPTPQVLPFTAAYRAYAGGMDAALLGISADVRAGKVTTKQAFLDALRTHSVPFSKAIDDLFTWKIDAAGKITDPVSLADAIDAAVKGAQ